MTVILRPYQTDLIARTYQSYQAGARNVLAVLPTGGGKSVIVSQIILDGHQQGLSECVIAHRNELVGQMSLHVARRGIPHRIIASKSAVAQITSEHRREFGRSLVNPDARCSVVSVDTLNARRDQLMGWAAQVQRWTIDECFPAGTMVATPTGDRPIEAVRVGDNVLAFDENTGGFHPRRVNHLFRNPVPKRMVRIDAGAHHVVTTTNHPFWTARGWIAAGDLETTDDILVDLRGMRQGIHDRKGVCELPSEKAGARILQPDMRLSPQGPEAVGRWISDERETRPTDAAPETTEKTTAAQSAKNLSDLCIRTPSSDPNVFFRMRQNTCVQHDGAHEPQIRIGSDDKKQPHEDQRNTREDAQYTLAYEPSAEATWWEWKTTHRSGISVDRNVDSIRVQTATHRSDQNAERVWISNSLQVGYGASRFENLHRSGWQIARNDCTATIRCAQRRIFAWRRVDSIAVHQRTNNDRDTECFVYNIEVDDFHTYVANGIVVHNCHHVLRSNKWGKAVTMFPNAYGLGVTATAVRADGMGLGAHHDGVFEDMIAGPSMRDLIDIGALCDYQIACPTSDFEIDESELAPSGDWSTKRMREASKRSHIVGDVVVEYQKHAPGKRAICFATDVETAGEMAARFNDAGILAAAVSAKTPTETRNEYIRRFRDGRLTMLVNVDLFGEGFDVPAVEVVIMARPTASLAVYLQQFGRALRPMDGKPYGLVIDHVSNWKRHGFPDKPHIWTLDRREKRAKQEPDPEDIPLTACRACSRPYERALPACPYCGNEPPAPEGGARSIDQVDGDLMLLDRQRLAEMRAAMQLETPAAIAARVGHVAGDLAGKGAANRQIERHAAQARLRQAIEQWAGCELHKGRSERETYRRFFLTLGVDVLSAMAGSRAEMESLAQRVEGWYRG